jgi:hypothetical protein
MRAVYRQGKGRTEVELQRERSLGLRSSMMSTSAETRRLTGCGSHRGAQPAWAFLWGAPVRVREGEAHRIRRPWDRGTAGR